MELKENLKIGLLSIIAVTLIINTYTQFKGGDNTAVTSNTLPITPPTNTDIKPIQANEPVVPSGPTTSILFAEEEHNFGTIKQDSENHQTFVFTNTGTEPLIIANAKGSCGCTIPEYPKDPIAPGDTGEIKVTYKPGKQKGSQTKTVTITANTTPSTTQFRIKADVEEI
jgi:hypothetical protein